MPYNDHRGAHASGTSVAKELLKALAELSVDPPGVTRIAYGEGERLAFETVAAAARAHGASIDFDPAGNQFMTLPGRERSRTIMVGSHLDSVPHGGNFDGAAGVVLGVALQVVFRHLNRPPPYDLTVACLRAEESCWFPHSYIGSKAALGMLPPSVLDTVCRSDSGRSLGEHMREEGFDPEAVRRGEKHLVPERIAAFIEPHIEQGPILEAEAIPLGLVTSIRGSFRHREGRCLGAYDHSGTTPLANRRDAVVAVAELIAGMQAAWEDMAAADTDLSVTFGKVGTDPVAHSFSKVAGECHFCLDVRSQDPTTLADVRERLNELSGDIATRRDVEFDFGVLTGSDPAPMSPHILDGLAKAAERCGLEHRFMASGAGHDAATFAHAGIPTGMVFLRNANGSHNPDEAMEIADFERALALMTAFVDRPAESWA